jgi:hypothetical protein
MDELTGSTIELKTPVADPKNLTPVPVEWSKNGEDLISVFLKRGDQSVVGKRHLQPCGYIDPDMFYTQNKYLPVITEFNDSAFTHVQVQRSRLSFIVDAITKNADYEEQGKSDRVLFDDAILTTAEKSKILTPDFMAPIDLSSKSGAIVKEVKTPTAKSQLVTDLNAISVGEYTYGSGGTYTLQGLAYADIAAALTGNLTLRQISVLSETIGSSLSTDMAGFTFEDNGQNYLDTVEVNAIAHAINGNSGTAGTIIIRNQYYVRGATELSSVRYLTRIFNSLAHNVFYVNNRLDSSSVANTRGVLLDNTTTARLRFYNNIIKNNSSQGVVISAAGTYTSFQFANNIIDTCITGLAANNNPYTIRNTFYNNNSTADNTTMSGMTLDRCGTNRATMAPSGATVTNPQLNVNPALAFINTDIADMQNGYRSKKGGQLYDTGVESGIAERTTNLFGEPIKAPYEIGVGREQDKRRAGGGSILSTSTGLNLNT